MDLAQSWSIQYALLALKIIRYENLIASNMKRIKSDGIYQKARLICLHDRILNRSWRHLND